MVLIDPNGDQLKYMVHLEFKATNNMEEYEALIFSLTQALTLGVRQLLVKGDSQLIIKQVRGDLLTLLSAPDLYTASARFRVAFPLEYFPRFINPRNQRDKKQSTSIEIPLY